MKLNENKDYIANLLKDAIIAYCKNVVSFKLVLNIEGFIVVTCDEENVLVVKIDHNHKGNCGAPNVSISNNAYSGTGATSKLFPPNNKSFNARQPLSLQYSNWNTNVGETHVLKQPRARQRASHPSKKVAFNPRGMDIGPRMVRPRMGMNSQRGAHGGAKRGSGSRQRFSSSFPRNVAPSYNNSQSMAIAPMTNFRQRMPSMNSMRQPVPIQNTQLALQYVPSRLDPSDVVGQTYAICDVASNEVVETTSPEQVLDESREKMFQDVVLNALSKLDGKKSTEQSLSAPNSTFSETPSCVMALVPMLTSAITPYTNAQKSSMQGNSLMADLLGKQSLVVPHAGNAAQQVHNFVQYPEKVTPISKARSTSQLQISLITMPKSSNSSAFTMSMQPTTRQLPNLLPAPPQQMPLQLVQAGGSSFSHGMKQHHILPMVSSSEITRALNETLLPVSKPRQNLPSHHHNMSAGMMQWPDNCSQQMARMQQAFTLSSDVKKQLHGAFDHQLHPISVGKTVQKDKNIFSNSQPPIQPRYVSPLKNVNYVSIVGPSFPFHSALSQSSQNITNFRSYPIASNPYFTIKSSVLQPELINNQPISNPGQSINQQFNNQPISNPGQSINQQINNQLLNPGQSLNQQFNNQPISNPGQSINQQINSITDRKLSDQQRNMFNQFNDQHHAGQPQNPYMQYNQILQNQLNQNNHKFSNTQSLPSGQHFLSHNFQVGHLVPSNSQQQIVRFQTPTSPNETFANCIRKCQDTQPASKPLVYFSGATVSSNTVDSLPSRSLAHKSLDSSIPFNYKDVVNSTQYITLSNTFPSPAFTAGFLQPFIQTKTSCVTTTPCLPKFSGFDMATDKNIEKRLPPLRLKNLGHGNLMVIESNNSFAPGKERELDIPQKGDHDLESIALDQVMMAVVGLKQDSSKKHTSENPDVIAKLLSDYDNINHNFNVSNSGNTTENLNSLCLNSDNEATSQIIRDVRLSSVDEIFNQNPWNDDLISGNLTLEQEDPTIQVLKLFDVCRNEVVITRNGTQDSPSKRQSDGSDRVVNNNITEHHKHKDSTSESSDTMDMLGFDSRVESCSDMNFDNNLQGQYTCQACQISMDSHTMLAEHYSTFHTNPEIHWREYEVKPYMDKLKQYSSLETSAVLSCPFDGCSRTFTTLRQVATHFSKGHKIKMTRKQSMMLRAQEGSLVRCEYCKLHFTTKRLLNEHISKVH